MHKFIFHLLFLLLISSCNSSNSSKESFATAIPEIEKNIDLDQYESHVLIDTSGTTVQTRFNPPKGFTRTIEVDNSFSDFLRNFKLKPHGTPVYTYDKSELYDYAHIAVLDIDVGNKDLQQCADAVMRLKAEYHFAKKEFDSIHFNFTNGFRVDYNKWRDGYRIGSNYKSWHKKYSTDTSYANFREYMDMIFMFAGTLSLSRELKPKSIEDIAVGDVFIFGGTPGHAVIVVDVCENSETGERLFMMAQSYMPAQSVHILQNHENEELSPWYSNRLIGDIITPLWTFEQTELMTFD